MVRYCPGITKHGSRCKIKLKSRKEYCCQNHELSMYPMQCKKLMCYILLQNLDDRNIRKIIYQQIYCKHTGCKKRDKLHFICCICSRSPKLCRGCKHVYSIHKTQNNLEWFYLCSMSQ